MRLKLLVELPDTPGQLLNILQPLSSIGANVTTIIHEHDNKTSDGKIPVYFTIEGSRSVLKRGMDIIRENDSDIVEIDGVLQKEYITFLLIGEITTTSFTDTIHAIDDLNDVSVATVDLNIGNHLQESVCKIVVETRNHRKLEATRQIKELTEENNLILIKEI